MEWFTYVGHLRADEHRQLNLAIRIAMAKVGQIGYATQNNGSFEKIAEDLDIAIHWLQEVRNILGTAGT